ncbi:MAG: bifunctional demethylmenaquinone methyltransferase/2-methoxy-6-polyprenyl-1,4-benzoquinol methylase UbiE [Mucinivorans sp.]
METKKERVRDMFNSIAPRYDLLNHTLSLNIDRRWRAKVVKMVCDSGARTVLDVATGTGDLAIGLAAAGVNHIVGVDLSPAMADVGRCKVKDQSLDEVIEIQVQDVEQLNFETASFQAVTCGFGVRNFENLDAGLSQMHRVLADGGGCFILEFSKPGKGLWGAVYGLYFHHVLPLIGRMISGSKAAYSYLPASVDGFVCGDDFLHRMRAAGFDRLSKKELMGAIATIYIGYKTTK